MLKQIILFFNLCTAVVLNAQTFQGLKEKDPAEFFFTMGSAKISMMLGVFETIAEYPSAVAGEGKRYLDTKELTGLSFYIDRGFWNSSGAKMQNIAKNSLKKPREFQLDYIFGEVLGNVNNFSRKLNKAVAKNMTRENLGVSEEIIDLDIPVVTSVIGAGAEDDAEISKTNYTKEIALELNAIEYVPSRNYAIFSMYHLLLNVGKKHKSDVYLELAEDFAEEILTLRPELRDQIAKVAAGKSKEKLVRASLRLK